MATEVCSASSRISLSQGILTNSCDRQRKDGSLMVESGSNDFNFSIDLQISSNDSSTADELFSDGKMLPFFKNPSVKEIKSGQLSATIHNRFDPSAGPADDNSAAGRRSFWRFGRSSSVGSAADPAPILPLSINRCKSAGSTHLPVHRRRQIVENVPTNLKLRTDSKQKKIYYFSGSHRSYDGAGIRISPIINVPSPIITTSGNSSGVSNSAFAGIVHYLLCNCGSDEKDDRIEDQIVASRLNESSSFNFGD